MKFDRNKIGQDILKGTKMSYERREGDTSTKYFSPDVDFKLWRAAPTKGRPHIIDIIPYVVGKNYPTKTLNYQPGEWAYVLDIYTHSNVGPGKAMVVCPAKSYGSPCPVCDEVDLLISQGVEWQDIPFTPKRRCAYNVLVMDDTKTEMEGVQIWEVAYGYAEKQIVSLAKNPRDGGYVSFASPDKSIGRSIAFDVDNDTYKKITSHRFEPRDYDIPDEILEQAHCLDELIIVMDEEGLRRVLFGPSGKRSASAESDHPVEQEAPRRSLRSSLRKEPQDETKCEAGAQFGADYGKYDNCANCQIAQLCAEEADRRDAEEKASKAAAPAPVVQGTPPSPLRSGRVLLKRG